MMEKSFLKRLWRHIEAIFPEQHEISLNDDSNVLKLLNESLRLYYTIKKMPKKLFLEILDKIEEQDRFIASLEKCESEYSLVKSDKYIQQQFYEEYDWFYPDDDYIYNIKNNVK